MARLMAGGTDLHTNGLYTFSALYPGQSIDESEYIHEVERAVGSIPHYAYPQLDDFWNEITEWIWYQEEPTIASAPYAYYSVYRARERAREGDGERQRRRRAARGLHPLLPRVSQLRDRAASLPRGGARDREGLGPLQEVLRAKSSRAELPGKQVEPRHARELLQPQRRIAQLRGTQEPERAARERRARSSRRPTCFATKTRTRWHSRSRPACRSSTTRWSSSSSRCRSTRRSRAGGTAPSTATR